MRERRSPSRNPTTPRAAAVARFCATGQRRHSNRSDRRLASKLNSQAIPLLAAGHRWYLFADPGGVDDEFERIRIFMLLHQLEVNQSSRVAHGRAVGEPLSRSLQQ